MLNNVKQFTMNKWQHIYCLNKLNWINTGMTRNTKRDTFVTFRPLVKQTTTRNLYVTIYIYFLDGRLCEVGAVRRGIRIVRRWRLELFDVRRRWPRQRTQRDDERGFVNSGNPFSVFFCSIRWPYITFKLPRRDKDTPIRLCNFSDLRRLGCVTSAHLEWPVVSSSSGNNCHAVHRSISLLGRVEGQNITHYREKAYYVIKESLGIS